MERKVRPSSMSENKSLRGPRQSCTQDRGKEQVNKSQEKDVLFAYMPYHNLTHPALGASILKKCLEANGISARVAYYGIGFAEVIGIKAYTTLLNSSATQLKAERTFVEAAFGDQFLRERQQEVGRSYPWDTEELKEIACKATRWTGEIVNEICTNPPRILICSSMFQQNIASLAVLRGVKERCPKVLTIMGGPNTEGILGIGLLRRATWLDYICSGEGEETLPELCNQLLNENHDQQHPIGVLSQRDVPAYIGRLEANLPRPSLANMNASPAPCFDDYFADLSRSSLKIDPGLLLESSRGCWWGQRSQCTFCGLNGEGMAYRARDPIGTKAMVEATTERYGIKKIEFVDNIIAKNYFDEFLPLLGDQDLTLFYETKADFSESDAIRFHDSGVRFVQPGIESLSDQVLKLMRKGTSAAINVQCLRLCREYGIRPSWSILSAFPGEEESWYKETCEIIPLITHLPPPNGVIPIRYDRFSPYHDNPSKWQLELVPFEAYRHLYTPYQGQHADIAYFFKKKGMNEGGINELTEWGPWHWACRDEVKEWQDLWKASRKLGAEHPKLCLEQASGWYVLDGRRSGTTIKTAISDAMHTLLITCRKGRSDAQLQQCIGENKEIKSMQELNNLRNEARAHGWILNISNQWITLVQNLNHQQLPISQWPGGVVLRQHQQAAPRIARDQGSKQASQFAELGLQARK